MKRIRHFFRWLRMWWEWPDLTDIAMSREDYEEMKRYRRCMYGLDGDK